MSSVSRLTWPLPIVRHFQCRHSWSLLRLRRVRFGRIYLAHAAEGLTELREVIAADYASGHPDEVLTVVPVEGIYLCMRPGGTRR